VSSDKRLGSLVVVAVCALAMPAIAQAQIWYPPPYPPPYAYRIAPDASVRLEVTPKDAEVYVDGYYAGIVDDFDGFFQRLHTTPGQHDVTVYHEGYRTATEHVYLSADNTFKIKFTMEKLAPGDVAEPRPSPPPAPPAVTGVPPVPPRGPLGRRPLPRFPPPCEPPPGAGAPPGEARNGTISLRVQPADAEILVDGQPWRLGPGQDRLTIDTSEGRHNVQAHRDGYIGYLTDVEVRRGQATDLDISLRRQP
jgi:hypothetical protein